jgi:hypothetical protein
MIKPDIDLTIAGQKKHRVLAEEEMDEIGNRIKTFSSKVFQTPWTRDPFSNLFHQ